jgi:hypothetical protein
MISILKGTKKAIIAASIAAISDKKAGFARIFKIHLRCG